MSLSSGELIAGLIKHGGSGVVVKGGGEGITTVSLEMNQAHFVGKERGEIKSSESKTDSSSDAETDMDETDPYAVIKALRRQLDKKDKKIKAQEKNLKTVLSSVREFQGQQKALFSKYTDLKHTSRDLSESMHKLLWQDLFSKEVNYNFLAIKEEDARLEDNEDSVGGYDIGDILGEGQFATVKSCFNKETRSSLAVKIMTKAKVRSFESLKRIDNEIDVLQQLAGTHPGILNLVDVMHGQKYLYMFTEKLDLDLFDFYDDHPNGVTENLGRLIIMGIMEGVGYIHSKMIAHRDLKPENILLRRVNYDGVDEYDVVLCDFGLCCRVPDDGELMSDFCGSPGFFAPEMFVAGKYCGRQADVWSMGCILLELLVGHDTFGECWMTAYDSEYMKSKKGFRSEIQAAVGELKELRLPKNLSGFLQLLLDDVDGTRRPPVYELLKHDWILEGMDPSLDRSERRLSSENSPHLKKKRDSMSP